MKRGKRKACQLFLLAVCMLLLGAAMPVKADFGNMRGGYHVEVRAGYGGGP